MNTCKIIVRFFTIFLYFFAEGLEKSKPFFLYLQCSKIIDIFIRREVVDAHEMGIFLYPEHCSYTNIIYSLRLPLPKSLPHFRVLSIDF